jgi:CheY-like chemotaxis protein
MKILCADDTPANLILLEAILLHAGFEVIKACDGKEAFDIVREGGIDLAILDVMMPKLNGHEVCKAIKGDERYRSLPVIMLTGLSDEEEERECFRAGADGFITKPLDFNYAISMINRLLKSGPFFKQDI